MRIGIVAGEPSGDRLAAALIEAIRRRAPQARFSGMAGPRMVAAGCEPLYSIEQLSVVGFFEVLRHYPRLRRLRAALVQSFLDDPPDVFIGVDVPDFVLEVEARLRAAGIRTAHLVSPTVWAWRPGRVATVARAVDLLLCIFPFEPAYYAGLELRCEFVGHPLADEFPLEIDRTAEREKLGVAGEAHVLALLPGSRMQELRLCTRAFLETAQRVRARDPSLQVLCAPLDARAERFIEAERARWTPQLALALHTGRSRELLGAADAALITSGTTTVEALLAGCPSVIAYRMNWASYLIARALVRTPWIGMANIIAGRELFPEFVQGAMQPAPMAEAVARWLEDAGRVRALRETCATLHAGMRRGAADRAAEAVLALAGRPA
ncbi:MAG: lipid-A-disaccharide synthase [Burkholderiales bacterium]|nr:lipid-A-disaccharide synthase [Burkholderiales bacterium]